jgi:hypothetical protein
MLPRVRPAVEKYYSVAFVTLITGIVVFGGFCDGA